VDGFGGYKFAGLANYNRMLRDPLFMKSLGVTTVYVLCLVPGLYLSGLGLALLVLQRIPFVGLWRTLFFMPFVVSLVVVALIWKVMLIDKVGFINRMFELVGLQGRSRLGDPNLSRTNRWADAGCRPTLRARRSGWQARVIFYQRGELTLNPNVPPSGFASALKDKRLRRMETSEIRCAACFIGPAMRLEQLLCFGKELTRFFKKRRALRLRRSIPSVGIPCIRPVCST
jgi:hypothetical protein